jgi:hypothetical protein
MKIEDSLKKSGLIHICSLEIERDATGHPIIDFPQNRYENPNRVQLNANGKGPFCRLNLKVTLSDGPGVYAITVDDSVVYIGECENLRRMFSSLGFGIIQPSSCFVGGQSTNCKVNSGILEAILSGSVPNLWFLPDLSSTRKAVKKELVSSLVPEWNTVGKS